VSEVRWGDNNKSKINCKNKSKVNYPTLAKGRLGWGTRSLARSP
jgi:hypothetical protein